MVNSPWLLLDLILFCSCRRGKNVLVEIPVPLCLVIFTIALFIYNAEIFCFAEIFCLAEFFCFAEFFCLGISAGAEIFCSKSLRQKFSVPNSCPNEMGVWSLPGWLQLGNSKGTWSPGPLGTSWSWCLPTDTADNGMGPMDVWEPLPDKVEQKFKKHPTPYTLGNILVMVPTRRRRQHRDGHHGRLGTTSW